MATLADLVVAIGVDNSRVDRGARETESKFGRLWDRVKATAAVAGAAIGAAAVAGLAGALELDRAQARFAAQLGDPALAEHLGRIAGQVYGRGFGESAADAMQAVQAVTSTGLVPADDAKAIEDLTVAAQAYATVWGVDVADAMSTASTLVKSGLARDATHALDLLTVASRKVPLAMVGDLHEVSAEYAQFFESLGFTGEQAFALLAAGADKGKWGIDKVGDAIKEFSILATELDGPPADALRTLGFNARQMQNDLLAGGDTARAAFDKTIDALLRVRDPAEQAQLAMDLFGTPLEDLSKADIPAFLASLDQAGGGLGDVAGEAQKTADTLEKSASQKLQAFKNQVQQALVEKLAEAIPYIEGTFGWLQENSGWVTPLATGLAVLAIAIGAVVAVTKIWTAVQTAFNIVMAMNPVTLVVLAVLALIAVIVLIATKTTWFQDLWDTVWGGIKTAASAVGSWFKDTLWGKWIKGAWDGIQSAGQKVWDWLKGLPGKLKDAFAKVKGHIMSPFKEAFNAVAGFWNRTVGSMSFTVPSWVPGGIGGKGFSMPRIPELADGGIIPATPGGTLALIGEGGQDEAVIPLPRGLREIGGTRRERPQRLELEVVGEREIVALLRRLIRQYRLVEG